MSSENVPDTARTSKTVSAPDLELTSEQLSRWQLELSNRRPEVLSWPITKLCLPGTHDSGTYGPGVLPTSLGRFNWTCQALNFYEQCKLGIRYFDLRLERENAAVADSHFYPFHGAAKKTGDLFSVSPELAIDPRGGGSAWKESIAGQLLRFIEENPSELLVLSLTVKDTSQFQDTVWKTFLNVLNKDNRCVPSPDSNLYPEKIPTVAEARSQGYNFVIIHSDQGRGPDPENTDDSILAQIGESPDPVVNTFTEHFVWKMPGAGVLKNAYISAVWKSNNPERVRQAIEAWMSSNADEVPRHRHFWTASCQLTPRINHFGNVIQSTWNSSMTTSPKKLSELMNPYVRDTLLRHVQWRQLASVIQTDFPDAELVLSIVNANLDAAR